MKRLILLWVLAIPMNAAAPYDPAALLLRVRENVMATVERLPNYLCTETIERTVYEPNMTFEPPRTCTELDALQAKLKWTLIPRPSNRMRVDVAFSREGEMYSAVGQNRFPDRDLAALVNKGVSSTGSFGVFLAGVFSGNAAMFSYTGEKSFGGRTVAEFRFHVSAENGGYSLTNRTGKLTQHAVVPYGGTFLADPETADLLQLTVSAEPLGSLNVCGVRTTLDYGKVQLNGQEFLLPVRSELQVANLDGSESVNRTSFASCHGFTAESSVQFGNSPVPAPTANNSVSTTPREDMTAAQSAVLTQARTQIIDTLRRLPRYICTETVARSTWMPKADVHNRSCEELAEFRNKRDWKMRVEESDRLRLDVAIAKDREMFSWVGENQFRDRRVVDWIGGGAMSTGAFGTVLEGIFAGNAAAFTSEGQVIEGGRPLDRFGFRVPVEKSNYLVTLMAESKAVAYHGTFLVDPKTFDLVRLTLETDGVPEELRACQITTTLNYSKAQLDRYTFLLPASSRLQILYEGGSESNNQTTFSSCHQFQTESKLTFGEVPDGPGGGNPALVSKPPAPLPPGLHFRLILEQTIPTSTAAAGDPIRARVETAIRSSQNVVLVPKGATVMGRIVQLKRIYWPNSALVIGIRLETIERGVAPQPFPARFENVRRGAIGVTSAVPSRAQEQLGSFAQLSGRDDPAVSFLEFDDVTMSYAVPKGLRLQGTTLPGPQ
jgi:hypothetical protein